MQFPGFLAPARVRRRGHFPAFWTSVSAFSAPKIKAGDDAPLNIR
jgi:hypothetical protein